LAPYTVMIAKELKRKRQHPKPNVEDLNKKRGVN
jgi:hypothetical protein